MILRQSITMHVYTVEKRVRLAMRMAQSSRVRAYRQQRLHLTRQNIHMMVIRRSRL